jgi:hypothetical protein
MLLGAGLVGCSDDKPAVCSSVDDLQTSVHNLEDIDVTSSSAVSDLEGGLATIESDLATVKTDAKSEFSSQIDAVDTSYTVLRTSVEAAKANPSTDTLAVVGTAASAFDTAVDTLASDVESTC